MGKPKRALKRAALSDADFQTSRVAAVFERYSPAVRKSLLRVRKLIFDTAAGLEGVGPLEEALRWGEPSYLTTQSGSGSMVRINQLPRQERACAVYFHCQTNLVETFRTLYSGKLKFEGNRAIVFAIDEPLPVAELRHCIALALTYFQPTQTRKYGFVKRSVPR